MHAAPEFLRGVQTPRTLMLLYHRIDIAGSDPQLLSVSLRHFEEHLQVLQKYRSMRCSDLVSSDSRQNFVTNSFVITFDDGYADNLINAEPVLRKYRTPATVFISTGMVQRRKEFWWDALTRIIFGSQHLPDQLELKLDKVRQWSLSDVKSPNVKVSDAKAADVKVSDANLSDAKVTFSQTGASNPHAAWSLLSEVDPTVRHSLYREISQFLRGASESERERALSELSKWARQGEDDASHCSSLTEEQVIELAHSDLIEIGSHSVNHPVLSALTAAEQRSELLSSKNYLEDLLGRQILGFAYPYGTRTDYTPETVSIAKEVCYRYACSNIAEVVWPGTDRFQAPRLLVRDCDGDYFEDWISQWYGES